MASRLTIRSGATNSGDDCISARPPQTARIRLSNCAASYSLVDLIGSDANSNYSAFRLPLSIAAVTLPPAMIRRVLVCHRAVLRSEGLYPC